MSEEVDSVVGGTGAGGLTTGGSTVEGLLVVVVVVAGASSAGGAAGAFEEGGEGIGGVGSFTFSNPICVAKSFSSLILSVQKIVWGIYPKESRS